MTSDTDRQQRAPLSTERVMRAAIQLADEGGIDALTMRRLGQALRVEAMSLYKHVANKDDILDRLVDLVEAEIELPSDAKHWAEAVRACAVSAHQVLQRHPWACNLLMTRFRPSRMRYMNWLLGQLREAGFSPDLAYHGYHVLDGHILGFTLWEAGHAIDPEQLADVAKTYLPRLRLADYPYLAEHVEQHLASAGTTGKSGFEFGLDVILDGLERMRGAVR
jgi:AcrR family transcriptional regulator